MTYSPPEYPTEIPTHQTNSDDLPPWYDDLDDVSADKMNALRLELCSVMVELGIFPSSNFTTVADRLQNFEDRISALE